MRTIVVIVALVTLVLSIARPAAAQDAARGAKLLARKGCLACHSTDGSAKVGPTFLGLYGSTRKVQTGDAEREVVADDAYVARSLREPDADVAVGFPRGNMPRFALADDEVRAIGAALASMRTAGGGEPARTSGMLPFVLSVLGFVGFHFLLSSIPVRTKLAAALGPGGFRGVYALVAFVFFGGILFFFGKVPYVEVWTPPRWTRWIPLVAMPLSVFFLVCGFSTPGPTTVGQGARTKDAPKGIQAVTRHPALWGFAIWAAAHLATNGELHVMVLALGILVLALGGMRHIDARRARELGDAWSAFAAQSSVLPFAAIAQGRARLRFGDIGLVRLLVAAFVYVGFLHTHALLIGASPYP